MLQKTQQITSSAFLSDRGNRSIMSSNSLRSKRKLPYKIQYYNQNLQQAIKEVKSGLCDNPQWRLNVKAVISQYPSSRQKKSCINQSQKLDKFQQSKMGIPQSKQSNENNIFKQLKFTDRKKRQFQMKMQEIKQRRMQLEASLLQKQMRAKFDRKIQQIVKLKEKRQLLKDIKQQKQQSIRVKQFQKSRKKLQSSLLHESNIANAKMIRKHRSRSQRRILNQQKSKSQQSFINLHFKQFKASQQKNQQREIILSRFKTIRSASEGSFKRKSIKNSQGETIIKNN